ncbi:MAG: 2-C-methyl-D-erythritol 2,4-cyclodiphosphate synthase [Armatimonadetes bacterium]|nr:2-C-methyl-D-erythritol 2,4-cyclodiphosphate synthase [Armatimonadota bacterium]
MSVAAVIVAAGQARRFGGGENKVFARLAGRSVLEWSLGALGACSHITQFVLVAAQADLERARALAEEVLTPQPGREWRVCEGGVERYDSVRAGLAQVDAAAELVAIHDGARPLLTLALVERLLSAARESGAAIPALPISDTIVRAQDACVGDWVDRTSLYTVQTPQVFRREWILDAYARFDSYTGPVTDDATLVRRLGYPVRLVPGDPDNLKVTVPEDLTRASEILLRAAGEMRTGFGYDAHRFAEGRLLFLGGVPIPHPRGLVGHSDADVLLHAICDALLGAAALGDIGLHYPNTDPRYAGIASIELLRDVGGKLAQSGWGVVNVDAMLLAESPKIRPYVDSMRERITAALGIDAGRVSIKATTNEGLGFVGRGEGIAACATATVRRVRQ